MAKQWQADRLKRLNDGRCPVLGLWMSQVDSWYEDKLGDFTLVGCSRKDCDVVAKACSKECLDYATAAVKADFLRPALASIDKAIVVNDLPPDDYEYGFGYTSRRKRTAMG